MLGPRVGNLRELGEEEIAEALEFEGGCLLVLVVLSIAELAIFARQFCHTSCFGDNQLAFLLLPYC